MDLSSSATQRSTSSEGLSIQPGSVRSPAADAANEFARHLAENNRAESHQRREDRSIDRPERNERRPERSRSSREDESETRKTARKENEKDEPRTDDTAEAAKSGESGEQTVAHVTEAAAPEEAATTDAAAGNVAAPETVAETETETGETATAAPEDETSETAANGSSESSTPETVEAGVTAIAAVVAPETAETKASATGTTEITAKAGAKASAEAAPPQAGDAAASAAAAAGSKAKAETGSAPLQGTQNVDGAAGDEAPDASAEELKLTEKAKPAKGLGQEAAEKLANRKADGRQAAEQPKAAPQQAAADQVRRAATSVQQNAPLSAPQAETSTGTRSGELPPSLQQTSSTNGNPATVRIGTLPGQSQPTQVPAAAIALQMARNLQKGVSRFDIRLDPPEMGRIDVRMEVRKDGHVVAHMTVERPETLDLLQRDARALQQALNNAGLQADSDSLNFTLRDENAGTGERDFADRTGGQSGTDEIDADAPLSPIYNVNLSINGGIDIRI